MSSQDDALRDIVASLRRRDRRFALVGGLAVSVRAEVRFTRDVDIALVAQADDDVERLIRELRGDCRTESTRRACSRPERSTWRASPISCGSFVAAAIRANRTWKRSSGRSPAETRKSRAHDVRKDYA